MRKLVPLSKNLQKFAQENRESLKDLPVMSLEELRAQTPKRAMPNMIAKAATGGKQKLSRV